MENNPISPHDYLAILKRRKWSLFLPAAAVFLAAVAVALWLPPVYKSTATILIEAQEVPAEFVQTTVTTYVEQRLQSINQRIMSSSRLLEIIGQYELYDDLRDRYTTDEIIDRMRDAVFLEPISAEVVDRRTGRPTTATIAFSLSFEGKETPARVQEVTNRLASLFLSENLKVRQRQAAETSSFIADEMHRVKVQLEAMDRRIATFKEEHLGELPELLQVNLQAISDLEREGLRLAEKITNLKEKAEYLQVQLASLPREAENPDELLLEELKVMLTQLKSRFSDEYPDVIQTRREIEELEKEIAAAAQAAPQLKENPRANPAYVTLASQLASVRAEIRSTREQAQDIRERRDEYRRRVEATPKVEEAYKALLNERANAQAKYDDLALKFMEARVSQGLETEQKGERFTLIDPPRLPEAPFKPNRLVIALIGLVLGLGAGVGTVALREFADQSVHRAETLESATSLPVLAAIPLIVTPRDRLRQRLKTAALVLLALAVLAGGIAAFHFYVMDLNLFWIKAVRRLAL